MRQIRCYRTVTLCNRGLYKQRHLYTPVFDSSVFDGLICAVARGLIWKLSRDMRICFVIAASWLGEQSPRKAVGLLGPGPHVVWRCHSINAPMKRRVVQRGQWPRSSDFASFLLLLLFILPVDLRAPDISIDIFENQLKAFLFTTVYLLRILRLRRI